MINKYEFLKIISWRNDWCFLAQFYFDNYIWQRELKMKKETKKSALEAVFGMS